MMNLSPLISSPLFLEIETFRNHVVTATDLDILPTQLHRIFGNSAKHPGIKTQISWSLRQISWWRWWRWCSWMFILCSSTLNWKPLVLSHSIFKISGISLWLISSQLCPPIISHHKFYCSKSLHVSALLHSLWVSCNLIPKELFVQ